MKWAFAVWFLLDAMAYVAIVGKPRKPITPGTATGVVLIHAVLITLLLTFWGKS